MKKAIAFLLCGIFCLSLIACTKDANSGSESEKAKPVAEDLVLEGAEKLNYNPLTGEPLADGVEAGTRPVAVMINNSTAAMPQRGIAAADALVEMVTEGGVTRIMGLYSSPDSLTMVGPVRSSRDQFLQMALPLNAIIVHIGNSIYSQNMLNMYQYQTVDGLFLGTTAFHFDEERAKTRNQEHCWYTTKDLIKSAMETKQISANADAFPLVNFASGQAKTVLTGDGAVEISFYYSDISPVRFKYDEEKAVYLKEAYGEKQKDDLDGAQVEVANILLLEIEIGIKPDQYCSDFLFDGGKGKYFYGGKSMDVFWSKGNPEDPLKITDENGEEIKINTGKTYIGFLDAAHMLELEITA